LKIRRKTIVSKEKWSKADEVTEHGSSIIQLGKKNDPPNKLPLNGGQRQVKKAPTGRKIKALKRKLSAP